MADLQQLLHEIDNLSGNDIKQVYRYLREHFPENALPDEAAVSPALQPRMLGMHAHLGKAWMSDDFRDELPDSFWLGEP
jgi:hypothetical protein